MTFALRLPEQISESNSRLLGHVTFVLPCRAKKGQHERASSSLVSRELHLTLFPQGQPRPGLASQKFKSNYENEKQI